MKIVKRFQATAAGEKRYFTGKPCLRGHIAERSVSTRHCFVCAAIAIERIRQHRMKTDPAFVQRRRDAANKWKRENPEKNAETVRKWRKANPDKAAERHKRWRAKDPEKTKRLTAGYRRKRQKAANEAVKKWMRDNPERARLLRKVCKHNRKTRVMNNGGRFGAADIEKLYAKQEGKCACCSVPGKLDIDHIIPVTKGGTSDATNLQLLCPPCNKSKSDTPKCRLQH